MICVTTEDMTVPHQPETIEIRHSPKSSRLTATTSNLETNNAVVAAVDMASIVLAPSLRTIGVQRMSRNECSETMVLVDAITGRWSETMAVVVTMTAQLQRLHVTSRRNSGNNSKIAANRILLDTCLDMAMEEKLKAILRLRHAMVVNQVVVVSKKTAAEALVDLCNSTVRAVEMICQEIVLCRLLEQRSQVITAAEMESETLRRLTENASEEILILDDLSVVVGLLHRLLL